MSKSDHPMLDGPRLGPLAGGKPTALVVLVHGYGSNGDDMISLATMIQPALPHASFLAPNAPSLLPHMADARQWWPIGSFSPMELAAGAATPAPGLDAFVDDQLEHAGLPDDRLLLVGFSQGTMMSLHVGLRRSKPLGGIIGISGMLVAPERLSAEVRSHPPVLLIHGTADEVVPFRALDIATKALAAADVHVETLVCPGVGHTVSPDGLAAAASFAARVLAA